jgi:hypothetical protein
MTEINPEEHFFTKNEKELLEHQKDGYKSFKKNYDTVFGLKVYSLSVFDIKTYDITKDIPDHFSTRKKVKNRMLSYVKQCEECKESGESRWVKDEVIGHGNNGCVKYLDYSTEKILCNACYKKYRD